MIQVRKYGLGNICNAKSVGDGITEIRVDYGPGYRVYLAQSGKNAYLLTGGHKGTKPTDIAYAKKLWSSR
jgi:putative addiction module killer protein